jgi:hypothetical protein
MKLFPLLSLTLLTTTTVVGTATQVQASQLNQSTEAIHQIYNTHKIDEAHWNLLVAVAKKGTVVRYNTPSVCKSTTDSNGVVWTQLGQYGWNNGKTTMTLCSQGGNTQGIQSTIRHEVGHMIQDLKDGGRGDGRLAPFYNTQDPEFWAFYSKSGKIDHEYVESFKKSGDMATYRLEADAEVQATETAGALSERLYKF